MVSVDRVEPSTQDVPLATVGSEGGIAPFVAKADFSSSLSMASWRRSSAQTERGIAELDASFSFSSLSLATLFFSSLIEAS